MASFTAQAALRAKWSSLVEDHTIEVPPEVSNKVTTVVGWLKQASLEVRAAGLRAVNTLSGGVGMTTDEGGGAGGDGSTPHTNHCGGVGPLIIIHYNDVYNVTPRQPPEPVGGAARFCHAVKRLKESHSASPPLVLFSGDCFSPSILSIYTKGEHMVPVLNEIGTHCAVFGNHDFDYGLEVLSSWVERCEFPWLMSNVIDNETGRPLGDGRITHVVRWADRTIGLIGLVEREWLDTLPTITPDETTFLDYVEAGQKLSKQLKQEGCDFVIALTHMRFPNDTKLAENCDDIDLILGGHDHVYDIRQINGKYVVKSGTDFRQFNKISVDFERTSNGKPEITIEAVDVTSDIPEDQGLKEILDKYNAVIDSKKDEVLGCFTVPLDCRFEAVRTSETNIGNWVCDVVLAATGADLVILNSGTFRSDKIHPPGDFTMGDLTDISPMSNPITVLKASGKTVLAALENAVSQYPKLEGRFAQVGGVSFAFDPSKPPGQRVDPYLVRIGDEYLKLDGWYCLVTKVFLYNGCDGYTMFKDCEVLVPEGESPDINLMIQNHFRAINMRLGKTGKHSKHRQSLVTLSRKHSLVRKLDGLSGSDLDGPPPLRRASTIDSCGSGVGSSPPPTPGAAVKLARRTSLDEMELETCQLAPRIEGRIVLIYSEEKRQELILQRQRLEEDSVIEEVDDESSPQN